MGMTALGLPHSIAHTIPDLRCCVRDDQMLIDFPPFFS